MPFMLIEATSLCKKDNEKHRDADRGHRPSGRFGGGEIGAGDLYEGRLSVGDEVLTAGGILGKITGVSDHYAVVQISDDTEIKIQKASISVVVPKGTFDEA